MINYELGSGFGIDETGLQQQARKVRNIGVLSRCVSEQNPDFIFIQEDWLEPRLLQSHFPEKDWAIARSVDREKRKARSLLFIKKVYFRK